GRRAVDARRARRTDAGVTPPCLGSDPNGKGGAGMIPAKFDYVRAGSTDEAVSMLSARGDDAKLIAGGHSLLPLMKLRLATPAVLVDVARIGELSYIQESNDHVRVGALTRHREVETSPVLAEHVPLLRHAASLVGDPQVR